jgi:hypothetical protein
MWPRRLRDPVGAHGAWVYLALSILAGALSALGTGFLPALLAGVGFAGVFICASALALLGKPGIGKRLAKGLPLAILAPVLALYFGAPPTFLGYSVVALFPAALSGYYAETRGFASAGALSFAVAALVVAAPCAACAGGASLRSSLLLLLFLTPFFAYRTWFVQKAITNTKGWSRAKLKRQGYMEAIYGVGGRSGSAASGQGQVIRIWLRKIDIEN